MSEPRPVGTTLVRAFRVVVLLAAVALVAFSWYTQIENRRLKRFSRELLAARTYPYIVTGLRLDIPAESDQLAASDGLPSPLRPDRALVLVSSDACGFCKQNLPRWEELVAQFDPDESDEVWLLTFDGYELLRPLAERLERSGAAYRVLRVRDPVLFSVRTGIVGVPLTMVLGADSSVELICSGGLGEREVAIFRDFLNGSPPPRGFVASPDPRTDPLPTAAGSVVPASYERPAEAGQKGDR